MFFHRFFMCYTHSSTDIPINSCVKNYITLLFGIEDDIYLCYNVLSIIELKERNKFGRAYLVEYVFAAESIHDDDTWTGVLSVN